MVMLRWRDNTVGFDSSSKGACEASCPRAQDMETNADSRATEGCFNRTFSALTVDDVYEIAKLIGAEVEKLIDGYGKESVEGLVPKIVKVLELLESFASRNQTHNQREEELLKTLETIQLQQQKKRGAKESEEGNDKHELRVRHMGAFRSPTIL